VARGGGCDNGNSLVYRFDNVVLSAVPGPAKFFLPRRKLPFALGLSRVFHFHQESAAPVAHEQVETVFELVKVKD
jgi:hypothetical protein